MNEKNPAVAAPPLWGEKVCRCSGTTRGQIRKWLEQGGFDLDALSRATGACSGCGGCDTEVLELIENYRALQSLSGNMEVLEQ